VAVLYNGKVRYVASIPIGANSLNADIQTLAIPASYVEDLKIQHGSAVAERAVDDVIMFQASKHAKAKTVLRRNLAIVIEARLKEIAEWIRREIKEAGCGSKFMPTLLLTGGGSQMRDIEKLFAQELEIMEARTVHPEYGFTDNMTDHITTSAYATVASLLLYGSMHGACSVAVGSNRDVNKPAEKTPIQPVEEKPIEAPKEREQRVEEKTEEEAKPTRTPLITVDPTPSNKVQNDKIIDDDDIFGTGSDDDDKPKWWDKIKKKISTMGDSFAGKDEEDF
jgi:cell division protein FtsA